MLHGLDGYKISSIKLHRVAYSWQYSKISDLKEVFDTFWVVTAAFATDAFDLLDLSGFTCCLNVLEMDLGVLTEINDGTEEIEQACTQTERNN